MDFQDLLSVDDQLRLLISGVLLKHSGENMKQLADKVDTDPKTLAADLRTIHGDLSGTATPELIDNQFTRNHFENLHRLYLQRSDKVQWIQLMLNNNEMMKSDNQELITLIRSLQTNTKIIDELVIRGWLTNLALATDDEHWTLLGWQTESRQILALLTQMFDLEYTQSTEILLQVWIQVTLTRLHGGFPTTRLMEQNRLPSDYEPEWRDLLRLINGTDEATASSEAGNLAFGALVFCQQLPETTLLFAYDSFEQVDALAERVSARMLRSIPLRHDAIKQQVDQVTQKFARQVINLHRRDWIMGGQLNYAPLPPMLNEQMITVQEAVSTGLRQLALTEAEQTIVSRLEPQYLALLADLVPLSLIRAPLHIALDFLHAPFWLNLIAQQIQQISQIPVVIDEQVTHEADIIITDGYRSVDANEMVWALPPTNTDWQDFAQLLLNRWQQDIT